MSPRASRNTDVRGSLIRAARDEIAGKGVAKVSLRAIARETGVSHQAAAHHFKDRAGLFTALATEGFESLLDDISAACAKLPDGATGADQVAAIGAAYVRFAEDQPSTFDIMFRPELVHPSDPAFLEAQQATWMRLFESVTIAHGEGWGGGVPVETLTVMCWSSVHGLATLRRDSSMKLLAGDSDIESLVGLMAAAIAATPRPTPEPSRGDARPPESRPE